MAWLRIDDRVRTHPKIATAGPAAAWLWFCGICYCREHLTDGFIPKPVVPNLAMNLTSPWRHAQRLVEVQLWEDAIGGFQVHDFLDWNPSRNDVEAGRDWEVQRKGLYRDKDLTKQIRQRDGDACRYCGRSVNWADRRGPGGGQHDHIVPRGPSTLENVVVACRECNNKKRDRTPEQAGMVLLPEPNPTQVGSESDQQIGTGYPSRGRAGDAGLGFLSGSGSAGSDAETREPDHGFSEFWQAYPRRVSKANALKAWRKIKPDNDLAARILSGLENAKNSRIWRDAMAEPEMPHVKHPATWLNGRCWEDEPVSAVVSAPVGSPEYYAAEDWFEECTRLHDRRCNGRVGHANQLLFDAARAEREAS
jgi:hypothetical protein